MKKASKVFYDLMINENPELVSPQHTAFYDAIANKGTQEGKEAVTLKETHNDFKLSSLSNVLVGLSEQALSQRRDVSDRDYPNKFYEQLLMPDERYYEVDNMSKHMGPIARAKAKTQYILMEPSYLKAWREFKAESAKLIPHIETLVDANPEDCAG